MPDEPAMASKGQSSYYYVNDQRVPLTVEPGVIAVKFKPGLRSTSETLLPETKRVLTEGTENTNFLPTYGLQIYRTSAGDALPVLSRDQSIEFATPAFHQVTVREGEKPDLMFATNRFLVQFKPEVTREQIDQLNARYHVQIVEPLGYVENGYLLAAIDQISAQNVIAIANAYYESGLVIFSNPDFIMQRHSRNTSPETVAPRNAPQASLSGQYLDQQWHLKLARVIDAWQIPGLSAPQGSPHITVCILDDGVAITHPEFSMTLMDGTSKIAAQFDFSSITADGTPKHEQDNHGTACAGVATAGGVNAYGAAPGCRLMAVRTPDYLGVADEGKMFQWSADNGADIISCSWGIQDGVGAVAVLPDSTRAAIHYCITKGRDGKGIPIFWAAGNGNEGLEVNGQPRDGYAANPEVMAITASTSKDTKAWYSDFGQAVCICAPSSGNANINESAIFTVDRPGKDGYNIGDPASGDAGGNYYNLFGGTSSAAPLVAGIAALMLSANPNLTVQQVRSILQQSAHKIGSASDYDSSGHSTIYGYGRVDAYAAVQSAQQGGGTSSGQPVATTPSIQAPASLARNAGAPVFQINPAPNQYYVVEVTTQADLFDITNHNVERTSDNFYGSWSDNATHDTAATYTLPATVWARFESADKLYYRVGSMKNSTGWDNYLVSTYDDEWQQAPFIQITDPAVGSRSITSAPVADDQGKESKMVSIVDRDANANATVNIHYEIELIPQPNKLACWAASMAMLVSYQQQVSLNPESLAEQVGRSLRTSYGWDMLEEVKDHFGFKDIALPSNASLYVSPEQWSQWLGTYGPLWITVIGAPSHAIIVNGIQGDLTPTGTTIEIRNPWNLSTAFSDDLIDFDPANTGLSYTESFQDFAAEFGNLGLDNYGNWRILYLPGTLDVAARDVARSVPMAGPVPVVTLPEKITSYITAPEQYSRNGPAPTFTIVSEQNRFFAVEAATHWSLFDVKLNGQQRTPQNFFGSWTQGLIKMEGETATYTLPPLVWATLRQATNLYYRVLTASVDVANWPGYQTSTPDEQASSAPSILLTGSAGKRLDATFIRTDEFLWRR